MKQTLRILLLLCVVGAPAYAQTSTLANTSTGALTNDGNETTQSSKVDDPPKIRLTSSIFSDGGGGGIVSFNASRDASNPFGVQDEMGFFRLGQAMSVRGDIHNLKGEFDFLCNDGSGANDAAMKHCLSFTYDGITNLSPGILNSLRGLIGGGGWSGNRFVSGSFMAQLNADGNFVIYDVSQNYKPVFDTIWLKWALAQLGYRYPY